MGFAKRGPDLHGGRIIGGCLVSFYLIFCLSWTLLARFSFKSFYWSANATMIAIPVGVCLMLHFSVCRIGIWETLWSSKSGWHVFSEFYLFLTWILLLLLFLLYTSLAAVKATVNRDAVVCAVVYGIAFAMVGASHILTSAAQKRLAISCISSLPATSHTIQEPSSLERCLVVVKSALRVILTIFLLLLLLLFLLLLVGTLYEVVALVRDWNFYRPGRFLLTVTVPPHLPASFYFRCFGPTSDSKTVLLEQGLLGMSMLALEFIPMSLAKSGIRACIYDRRGIGWSDPIETDQFTFTTAVQNSATNIQYLHALVQKANLSTPLVFAGHSYGGWHITRYALAYPADVEALVYIDASRFSQTNEGVRNSYNMLDTMFPLLSNFIPTGAVRFAVETGIVDFEVQFKSLIDLKDLSAAMKGEAIASLFGGSFFSRGLIEKRDIFTGPRLDEDDRASNLAKKFPILVIDVHSDWFPKPSGNLSTYTYVQMSGATHTSIVYSKEWGTKVADEIQKFLVKIT